MHLQCLKQIKKKVTIIYRSTINNQASNETEVKNECLSPIFICFLLRMYKHSIQIFNKCLVRWSSENKTEQKIT